MEKEAGAACIVGDRHEESMLQEADDTADSIAGLETGSLTSRSTRSTVSVSSKSSNGSCRSSSGGASDREVLDRLRKMQSGPNVSGRLDALDKQIQNVWNSIATLRQSMKGLKDKGRGDKSESTKDDKGVPTDDAPKSRNDDVDKSNRSFKNAEKQEKYEAAGRHVVKIARDRNGKPVKKLSKELSEEIDAVAVQQQGFDTINVDLHAVDGGHDHRGSRKRQPENGLQPTVSGSSSTGMLSSISSSKQVELRQPSNTRTAPEMDASHGETVEGTRTGEDFSSDLLMGIRSMSLSRNADASVVVAESLQNSSAENLQIGSSRKIKTTQKSPDRTENSTFEGGRRPHQLNSPTMRRRGSFGTRSSCRLCPLDPISETSELQSSTPTVVDLGEQFMTLPLLGSDFAEPQRAQDFVEMEFGSGNSLETKLDSNGSALSLGTRTAPTAFASHTGVQLKYPQSDTSSPSQGQIGRKLTNSNRDKLGKLASAGPSHNKSSTKNSDESEARFGDMVSSRLWANLPTQPLRQEQESVDGYQRSNKQRGSVADWLAADSAAEGDLGSNFKPRSTLVARLSGSDSDTVPLSGQKATHGCGVRASATVEKVGMRRSREMSSSNPWDAQGSEHIHGTVDRLAQSKERVRDCARDAAFKRVQKVKRVKRLPFKSTRRIVKNLNDILDAMSKTSLSDSSTPEQPRHASDEAFRQGFLAPQPSRFDVDRRVGLTDQSKAWNLNRPQFTAAPVESARARKTAEKQALHFSTGRSSRIFLAEGAHGNGIPVGSMQGGFYDLLGTSVFSNSAGLDGGDRRMGHKEHFSKSMGSRDMGFGQLHDDHPSAGYGSSMSGRRGRRRRCPGRRSRVRPRCASIENSLFNAEDSVSVSADQGRTAVRSAQMPPPPAAATVARPTRILMEDAGGRKVELRTAPAALTSMPGRVVLFEPSPGQESWNESGQLAETAGVLLVQCQQPIAVSDAAGQRTDRREFAFGQSGSVQASHLAERDLYKDKERPETPSKTMTRVSSSSGVARKLESINGEKKSEGVTAQDKWEDSGKERLLRPVAVRNSSKTDPSKTKIESRSIPKTPETGAVPDRRTQGHGVAPISDTAYRSYSRSGVKPQMHGQRQSQNVMKVHDNAAFRKPPVQRKGQVVGGDPSQRRQSAKEDSGGPKAMLRPSVPPLPPVPRQKSKPNAHAGVRKDEKVDRNLPSRDLKKHNRKETETEYLSSVSKSSPEQSAVEDDNNLQDVDDWVRRYNNALYTLLLHEDSDDHSSVPSPKSRTADVLKSEGGVTKTGVRPLPVESMNGIPGVLNKRKFKLPESISSQEAGKLGAVETESSCSADSLELSETQDPTPLGDVQEEPSVQGSLPTSPFEFSGDDGSGVDFREREQSGPQERKIFNNEALCAMLENEDSGSSSDDGPISKTTRVLKKQDSVTKKGLRRVPTWASATPATRRKGCGKRVSGTDSDLASERMGSSDGDRKEAAPQQQHERKSNVRSEHEAIDRHEQIRRSPPDYAFNPGLTDVEDEESHFLRSIMTCPYV